MSPADPTGAIANPGLAGRCRHQPTPFLPAHSSRCRSHNFGDQRRPLEFFAAPVNLQKKSQLDSEE